MVVRGYFKGAYTPEGKNIASRICFMINFSPHKLRVKCCNHCCNQMVVINTGVYYRRPFADTKNHTHHLIISFRGPLPHENRRRGWRTGMYMHTKKKKKQLSGAATKRHCEKSAIYRTTATGTECMVRTISWCCWWWWWVPPQVSRLMGFEDAVALARCTMWVPLYVYSWGYNVAAQW